MTALLGSAISPERGEPVERGRTGKMGSFLGGRSDRWEYWTSVALLTAAGLILPMLHVRAAVVALAVMWVVTWVRRLHDINLLLVILIAAGFFFGGNDFVNALKQSQTHRVLPISQEGLYRFEGFLLASLLVQYGFSLWLGVKMGDPNANRFGPPHGVAAVNADK
jgi:uncharacterized membrane protein YhaH (DUF805 family)